MKLSEYGSYKPFSWTQEYLNKYITTGKHAILEDHILANAFRQISRHHFLPENKHHLAYHDRDVEIEYGQYLTRPSNIALMLKALEPRIGGKYLDIGTGSGYFATILATAIGSEGEVYSIERVQWLWEKAKAINQKFNEVNNLRFLYRDGHEGLFDKMPFDGIHISFRGDDERFARLLPQLKTGGLLVFPTQHHIKVWRKVDEHSFEEELLPGGLFHQGEIGTI